MENNLTTPNEHIRESFVFYASFYRAIMKMPRRTQLTLFIAIANFALNGEEPQLKGSSAALWDSIRPQLEANNRRWESGKRGAKYGKQGGRPSKKAQLTEETAQTPVGLLDDTPNENVNVNVNNNVNEDVDVNVDATKNATEDVTKDVAESPAEDVTHTISNEFFSYLRDNTPSILQFREPFTAAQEEAIRAAYDIKTEVVPILEQMHNNQTYRTKLSAYATFNTYMEMRKQRVATPTRSSTKTRKRQYTYAEMCSIVTPSDPTSNFENIGGGMWVRKDKRA